jgi:DNA-binding GntR family transcriptional regulator
VRGADFAEMRESYELRTMLEMRSVKLAAPYKPQLLADLGEYLRGMDAAVAGEDSEAYIDNALRFHRRLVESSGNRTFLAVWDSLLWDIRGRIALRRLAEMGRSLKPLVSMHKALLGRLRAQDVAGATERVEAVLARVCSAFEQNGAAR